MPATTVRQRSFQVYRAFRLWQTHTKGERAFEKQVVEVLKERPALRWDAAVKKMLADSSDDDHG
jgi:hypothetical protein